MAVIQACHANSARTCSRWAAVGPGSNPTECFTFPWLMVRRPGYNPEGLQEGERIAVLAGREEVVKGIKKELYCGEGGEL